jgi:hypothetical protein
MTRLHIATATKGFGSGILPLRLTWNAEVITTDGSIPSARAPFTSIREQPTVNGRTASPSRRSVSAGGQVTTSADRHDTTCRKGATLPVACPIAGGLLRDRLPPGVHPLERAQPLVFPPGPSHQVGVDALEKRIQRPSISYSPACSATCGDGTHSPGNDDVVISRDMPMPRLCRVRDGGGVALMEPAAGTRSCRNVRCGFSVR